MSGYHSQEEKDKLLQDFETKHKQDLEELERKQKEKRLRLEDRLKKRRAKKQPLQSVALAGMSTAGDVNYDAVGLEKQSPQNTGRLSVKKLARLGSVRVRTRTATQFFYHIFTIPPMLLCDKRHLVAFGSLT